MNSRHESTTDRDPVADHCGDASPDVTPLTPDLDQQNQLCIPARALVPDDRDYEAFAGGSGI